MRKFNHLKFDAEFLTRVWELGINLFDYDYQRVDMDKPNQISRSFESKKRGTKSWSFSFQLDDREDDDGNFLDIELMAAKRAAYRMRDLINPRYHDNAIWLEDTLDRLMKEDEKRDA